MNYLPDFFLRFSEVVIAVFFVILAIIRVARNTDQVRTIMWRKDCSSCYDLAK